MDQAKLQTLSAQEVGQLFASKGYGNYAALFEEHNISGTRVLLLTPDDLREMGIVRVGDRLGIQQELQQLKSTARAAWRSAIIQEHSEAYGHTSCYWCFHTCCGMCMPELDQYRLTTTMLKITHSHSPTMCGRKCPCLGVRIENDMHPLNTIVDVDTTNIKDGMCAVPLTKIDLHLTPMSQGDAVGGRESLRLHPTAELVLPFQVGEEFAAQIRNQMEEYKRNSSFIGK
jgi:hypothetical protein